ncbi:hypothetical protein DVR12_17680 [Chitinophaga silvatica]|uniref:Uncharacterized protein n=1 Tax=Chitinophaga silvatica TaxID=2282649 RepID=A0A3E1Y7W7_9BACT|nr:hypothetical protein [Chitinophaga silvatica]RFS21164.1 hypothetical protein DVR12_17680 [Chitinophaga silvatica]
MSSIYYESIKLLSIKARLAFACRCLELALDKYKIKSEILDKVIAQIWEFTSEDERLDLWENLTAGFNTKDVLSPYYNNEDIPELTPDQFKSLVNCYRTLPIFICEIIDETIWIGRANLYSKVDGFSDETLSPLRKVITLMIENSIPLPGLDTFSKSSFTEDGGWGLPHTRSYYLEQ